MTLKKHYSRNWNYIDSYLTVQVPLVFSASVLRFMDIDFMSEKLLIWQTLGCQIAMWFKLFDWLRLFETTAYIILLVKQTIIDIGYFMIIFVAALFMFGNTMYMFELNKRQDADDIVTPTFGHFMLDSLYN